MRMRRHYIPRRSPFSVKAIYRGLPILALSACIGGESNNVNAETPVPTSHSHIYTDLYTDKLSSGPTQLDSNALGGVSYSSLLDNSMVLPPKPSAESAPKAELAFDIGIPLLDIPAWEDQAPLRAKPVLVNSMAGVVLTSNASVAITTRELEQSLGKGSTDNERLLTLGSYALAVELDRMLIINNKFEAVPDYRVSHVVRTLMEQDRRDKNESYSEIYDRILNIWQSACKSKIDKGESCNFVFKFGDNEWRQGIPDFSKRLSERDIAYLSLSYIEKNYKSIINDLAEELQKNGKLIIEAGSQDISLRADKSDDIKTIRKNVTEAYYKAFIARNFLKIDSDYIKGIYNQEISQAYKASVNSPLSEISIVIGGKQERITFSVPLTGLPLVNAASEEIRKLHSQHYFGTTALVIFPREDVNNKIGQFEWSGFTMTLPEAPKDYTAFLEAIRSKLNSIYLERTRTKMMISLVSNELNELDRLNMQDQYVTSEQMQNQLKHHKAFTKTASFDIIDIPLEGKEISDESIKRAANDIAEKVGKALSAGDNRKGLMSKVAKEVSDSINYNLVAQSITHSDVLSTALLPPEQSRALQLFQMLFAEELVKAGNDRGEDPNLVYFVDRERKSLSFILRTKVSRPQEVSLKANSQRLNEARLKDEVIQQSYKKAHEKVVKTIFEKSLHIQIKNPSFFGKPGNMRNQEFQKEILKEILASVDQSDRLYPGSGWARFLKRSYQSPVTPTDLKLSKKEKIKDGFLRLW